MLSMREVYDEYNNDNVVVVALFNSSTLNWPDLAEVQVVQSDFASSLRPSSSSFLYFFVFSINHVKVMRNSSDIRLLHALFSRHLLSRWSIFGLDGSRLEGSLGMFHKIRLQRLLLERMFLGFDPVAIHC